MVECESLSHELKQKKYLMQAMREYTQMQCIVNAINAQFHQDCNCKATAAKKVSLKIIGKISGMVRSVKINFNKFNPQGPSHGREYQRGESQT